VLLSQRGLCTGHYTSNKRRSYRHYFDIGAAAEPVSTREQPTPQRVSQGECGLCGYRQRRLQAQAEGRPFMPYTAAKARLHKALVATAAGRSAGRSLRRVFEE
jgi:hypothetical protein